MSGQGKVGILERIAKLEEKRVGSSYMMVADACKIMLDRDLPKSKPIDNLQLSSTDLRNIHRKVCGS